MTLKNNYLVVYGAMPYTTSLFTNKSRSNTSNFNTLSFINLIFFILRAIYLLTTFLIKNIGQLEKYLQDDIKTKLRIYYMACFLVEIRVYSLYY